MKELWKELFGCHDKMPHDRMTSASSLQGKVTTERACAPPGLGIAAVWFSALSPSLHWHARSTFPRKSGLGS